MWGSDVYPSFVRHIGQVTISPEQVSLLTVARRKVKSDIKKNFSGVNFCHWSGQITGDNHTDGNSSKDMSESCCATLKPTQDCLLSSNSIFRSGMRCPSSLSVDVVPGHSNFLDNKKALGGYIQIEKKFMPIKPSARTDIKATSTGSEHWVECHTELVMRPLHLFYSQCAYMQMCIHSKIAISCHHLGP